MIKNKLLILILAFIIGFSGMFNAYALSGDNNDNKISEDKNVAPQFSYSVKAKRPVDIIVLTDYTGQKYADLQSAVTNMKTQLIPKGADIKETYVSNMVKVGTIRDYLRNYARYATFNFTWDTEYWWSPSYGGTRYNQPRSASFLVEQQNCLETKAHTLPYRSPWVVSNVWTDSYTTRGSNGSYKDWLEYTCTLGNDVISTGKFLFTQEQEGAGNGYIRNGFNYGNVVVDRAFGVGGIISTVDTDLNIINVDNIKNVALRSNSERYLLICTDSIQNLGNLTTDLKNYITVNNLKIKASINELTKDYLLTQENYITKVFTTSREVYYFTRTKRWLRTGADSNSEYAVDVTEQIQPAGYTVYDIKEESGYIMYLKKDIEGNTLLSLKAPDGVYMECPLTNIIEYQSGYNYYTSTFYFLLYTADKKIYYYTPVTGSYSLLVNNASKLFSVGFNLQYKIFNGIDNTVMKSVDEIRYFTSNPYAYYGATEVFWTDASGNKKLRVVTPNAYGGISWSDVPLNNVKAAIYYDYLVSSTTHYNLLFVLTTDNKLYEYSLDSRILTFVFSSNTLYEVNGYNVSTHSYNAGVTLVPVTTAASCVKEYKLQNSTFFIMSDGTVTYKKIDSITMRRRSDGEGGHYWEYTPVEGPLRTAPFNGIKKILRYNCVYNSGYGGIPICYATVIDNSNNVYEIMEGWNNASLLMFNIQKLNTTLGTVSDAVHVKKVADADMFKDVYYLLTDGTVIKNQLNYSQYIYATNVSAISAHMSGNGAGEELGTLILLKPDGTVQGAGQSSHWQLGQNTANVTSLVNPLKSRVTLLNTTKPYFRMNDLMDTNKQNLYYNQGDFATALNDITKELTFTSSTTNNIVVVSEPLEVTGIYNDYETDPEYSRKWKFSHNPYYFENNMGLDPSSGIERATPLTVLKHSGRYTITGQARDNPYNNNAFDNYRLWSSNMDTLILDANRRPFAKARVTIVPNGYYYKIYAYDAGSYDLDHYSQANHGIVQYEWRWRSESEGIWHNEKISKSNCTADDNYVIQLRVLDLDGYWSDYYTIQIDEDNPPAALFEINKKIINVSESLRVKDYSFPQSFSTITQWNWVVKKLNSDGSVPSSSLQDSIYGNSNTGLGAMAGYDINIKTDYSSSGVGRYRAYLRVRNSSGLWSDGGTDATPNLNNFYSQDFEVDRPPTASFTIDKNPIKVDETLMLKDTSLSTGTSRLSKWHWIVKKLNTDGSEPNANIQEESFDNSNNGIGSMKGYDINVKTSYADKGAGTYRIYLRVMNGNGMWSDGGTGSSYILSRFSYKDLIVEESFKISSFRVVKVRDLHLESYYYNSSTGSYDDRPMYVNNMAVDNINFGNMVDGLTKGYMFEFEIDTSNFNDDSDTIEIVPHFYTCDSYSRDSAERDIYWENSWHEVLKVGEGGHAAWAAIELTKLDRDIKEGENATWRGSYLIPGTAWAVPIGTTRANAKAGNLRKDIIVSFSIKGYKDGEQKYDYNLQQWPLERTSEKYPYEVGDVIRYSHLKSNLEDNSVILNRP